MKVSVQETRILNSHIFLGTTGVVLILYNLPQYLKNKKFYLYYITKALKNLYIYS